MSHWLSGSRILIRLPQFQIDQGAVRGLGRDTCFGRTLFVHGSKREHLDEGPDNESDLELAQVLPRANSRAVPKSEM